MVFLFWFLAGYGGFIFEVGLRDDLCLPGLLLYRVYPSLYEWIFIRPFHLLLAAELDPLYRARCGFCYRPSLVLCLVTFRLNLELLRLTFYVYDIS
jgi:hypothetical protein